MTPENVLTMLLPALQAGINMSIYYCNRGLFHVDLDLKAKSNCILTIKENKLIANRRYNREEEVEGLDHLLELVSECGHGRGYFDYHWAEYLKQKGHTIS